MRQIVFYIFFFLLLVASAQGPDDDASLKYHWFEKTDNDIRPIIGDVLGDVVYFYVLAKSQNEIEICNEDAFSVWVNNQLVFAQIDTGCVKINQNEQLSNFGDTVFYRINSENLSRLSTNLVINEPEKEEEVLQPRVESQWLNDFIMIFMSFMLVLSAFYRQSFNLKFRRALRNPFNFKIRGVVAKDNYGKFLSVDNLFALGFLSFFLAGLLLIINTELGLFKSNQETLLSALGFWLIASFAFFAFCFIKYVVASALSITFDLQAFPNIQIQDFIHFMTFTSGITFILVFLDYSFEAISSNLFLNLARLVVIFGILFFQFWFYLKFVKYYSHRKLLIISYLCTTEFLPGFIAAYWLIN